ncbi:CD209 antigen-like protein C isoform X2 [Onychostoma macrolepis]|uniref:CD209 antigen-like protein C isoform X2 n=1 Tax=Onychostoma macrolepis TaxID=369639 RepID=UPI00272D0AEC|nr:CD209 antigen-like protein C isoform X2 [Onychostoma macrolepis]
MEFTEKDEDKEEMNIYANVHSVNIHDVRTETENTRKHQTPQHTEAGDQLLNKSMQLTKERDELLSSNHVLIKQTDQLRQEKNELLISIRGMDGWIYYQSNLYFISSEKKSWTESRRSCTERGADLIIINNRQEQDFVKKISANAHVWIGLTDIDVEGTWKWVDGSTLTSGFWDPREPNGHRGENCALIYSPGWADYPCSDRFLWICEKSILK